jgi:hypothetical protein
MRHTGVALAKLGDHRKEQPVFLALFEECKVEILAQRDFVPSREQLSRSKRVFPPFVALTTSWSHAINQVRKRKNADSIHHQMLRPSLGISSAKVTQHKQRQGQRIRDLHETSSLGRHSLCRFDFVTGHADHAFLIQTL